MPEKPTYEELEQRIALLENESAQRERFEGINRTLFKISNAVNTTTDLDELFRSIHLALSPIIDTTNFFIALYDKTYDSITFPYRVDTVGDEYPPVIEVSKTTSLTAGVIRTGRPVLVTRAESLTQRPKNSIKISACTTSEIWLGVPLKTRDKIIGVMAVQNYHDPMCYDQTDLDVMVSVADQLAIAVERKQAEDSLRESKDGYRTLFFDSPIAIALYDASGVLADVNTACLDIFGVEDPRELKGLNLFADLNIADNYKDRMRNGETVRYQSSFDFENVKTLSLYRTNKTGVICLNVLIAPIGKSVSGYLVQVQDITERKKTEQELIRAHEVLKTILDRSPFGVVVIGRNRKIRWANHYICALAGVEDATDLCGKECGKYLCPASQNDCPILDKHQEVDNSERILRRQDGLEIPILKTVMEIEMNGESVLLETFVDITGRKRAEETRCENEERLRGIIDQTQAGYFFIDLAGRYQRVNNAWLRMHGYESADEVIGRHYLLTQVETDIEVSQWYVEMLLAGGHIPAGEFSRRCRDGSVGYHTFSAHPVIHMGKIVGMEGFIIDITERKRAEEALEKKTRLSKILMDAFPCIALLIRPSTREIVASNQVAIKAGAVPGTQCFTSWGQRETPCPWCLAPSLWATGKAQHLEVERPGVVWDAHWIPVSPDLYMHYYFDITERKRADAEKEKLEDQNRHLLKSESLGRMAGAIAHHFNNQLQAVMGNLEIAMEVLPRDVDISETLAKALKAALKAAEVSSLMLTYLGQTPGKRELLDLSEVCSRSLPMIQAVMPKDVLLETDFHSPGLAVMANANQIQQVIINLITNAWEATDQGRSAIHLAAKSISSTDIPTTHRYPMDWRPDNIPYACLEVADAGCGIANKDIEKIFDPFFSSKFTGRGLGLPVVLGIARAHGGVVTVESRPGQGSAFRIFFPLSAEEVPAQPYKAAQAPKIQGGGTVLLIEDEEQVRNMVKIMLTRLGFTVLEANDGIEALEVFRQHQTEVRCILSDLTMPRMGGWETLAALRKLSPDIPVILSSGYDEAQVMAGEHPERPNAFLGKPYQLKGLSDTIRNILANKAEGR
ncbi:MAG: PAS domain S-box protein [Deltaproteobacteria bacterium]|nr:PAS domain S-box protein [Deltaproteobacteria bacterium]